jgi:hypothetical protein
MGLSVAQLLESHLVEGELVPWREIAIRIDQTLTQDATGTLVMLEVETMDYWGYLPFRDFELARPTPDGGNRYVRWPTNRRPPWTGAWTFAAPWSRSSRGSMHRGRIDRCYRMPSP